MSSFTFDDVSFTKQLDLMSDNVEYACRKALYEGAGILADSINKQIDDIPDSSVFNDREREDLKDGLVISRFLENDGNIVAYIDFSKYNNFILNGKFGNEQGEPIRLIARSICKGTQKRTKYNFVKKGFDKAKKEAEETMVNTIEEELNKKLK